MVSSQELHDASVAISRPMGRAEKLDLDRMRGLMEVLGNPQDDLPVVHVTGTAGKGSTAWLTAAMLQACGYRTGLHVKPHLHSLAERFLIDGVPIPSDDLLARIRDLGARVGDIGPTWFEVTSGLALRYFRDAPVDVAVIEVGMGGTTDATNVVRPLVSIVTNIGEEHLKHLGGSLRGVAEHKAGIIKPGCTAVSGVTQPDLAAIIRDRSAAVGSDLLEIGREFEPVIRSAGAAGSEWDLRLGGRVLAGLRTSMVGEHQVANATLAVVAATALAGHGMPTGEDKLREGLAAARVPGRLETVREFPRVIVDGAHCQPELDALAIALDGALRARGRRIGVIALSRAQDPEKALRELSSRLDAVVVTGYENTAEFGLTISEPPESLAATLAALNPALDVHVVPDALQARDRAVELAGPDDLICVTGSYALVAIVRDAELGSSETGGAR